MRRLFAVLVVIAALNLDGSAALAGFPRLAVQPDVRSTPELQAAGGVAGGDALVSDADSEPAPDLASDDEDTEDLCG
jgi:hypothetical protein